VEFDSWSARPLLVFVGALGPATWAAAAKTTTALRRIDRQVPGWTSAASVRAVGSRADSIDRLMLTAWLAEDRGVLR
jgi:hypothetical protein